jgi:ADP-ribosyl-[dinitrogen reductase] hydrolase
MKPRTSHSHPLNIAPLATPGGGRIGMTFCPGKTDLFAMSGPWAREMDTDLAAIQAWGASALVTLVEQHELVHLGVGGLGERVHAMGLDWYHLPIQDVSIPTPEFETQWRTSGQTLRERLLGGQSLVVHCRGGLGRTGLIAARLLIELGESPQAALRRVRAARPGAVETPEQEMYVLGCAGTGLS